MFTWRRGLLLMLPFQAPSNASVSGIQLKYHADFYIVEFNLLTEQNNAKKRVCTPKKNENLKLRAFYFLRKVIRVEGEVINYLKKVKMKKLFKKTNLVLAMIMVIAAGTFSSCSTMMSGNDNAYRNVVGLGIVSMPQVADLDIHTKRIHETKKVPLRGAIAQQMFGKKKHNTTNLGQVVETAKNSVVSEILVNLKADVLFAPRFYVVKKGSSLSITVSGYSANYKNFRPMTTEDAKILEIKPAVVNSVYEEKPLHE